MTMHMEGPWLSTTGKRRGKAKHRNAESAQRARELSASWTKLKQEWGATEQESKRNRALRAPAMTSYTLSYPPGREPKQHIPSKDTGVAMAAAKDSPVYTGTAMLGIGTMHKSNSVPIFSDNEAQDIARMRR